MGGEVQVWFGGGGLRDMQYAEKLLLDWDGCRVASHSLVGQMFKFAS